MIEERLAIGALPVVRPHPWTIGVEDTDVLPSPMPPHKRPYPAIPIAHLPTSGPPPKKSSQKPTYPQVATPTPQALEKLSKISREDWADLEVKLKGDIAQARREGDKRSLVSLVTACAIAHDKAYKSIESESPALISPLRMIEQLLALTERLAREGNALSSSAQVPTGNTHVST
jgi:hypothetical protein